MPRSMLSQEVRAQSHLVLGLQRWSGPPACHVAIPGDILPIIGTSYLKNVGTIADMAGQRPAPPLASDVGLTDCATMSLHEKPQ